MWRDTTSYSQGQRGVKEPTTFTARSGRVSITVTSGHRDCPGEWVTHCREVGIDTQELHGCQDLDEAKDRAIALVKVAITNMSNNVALIEEDT